MRLCAHTAAIAASLLALPSIAAAAETIELDGVVVTSTKTPQRASEALSASSSIGGSRRAAPAVQPKPVKVTPAPVAAPQPQVADLGPVGASGTTDRSYLEQIQPGTVSGLLREVPNLSTSDNHNDPAQSIGIRGLQDFGRVNVMVDGARQDFQVSGHARNGTFYLEPELIAGVDITRGPSSTVYGSGAIGGVVNFETNTADSVLAPGQTQGVMQKFGYDTNGNAFVSNTMLAMRSGDFDVFGQYVYRHSNDYEDGNGNKVKDTGREDPYAAAAKLRWRPAAGSEVTFGAVMQEFDFKTYTLLTPQELTFLPPGFKPTEYNSVARNNTYSAKYTYSRPDDDLLHLSLKAYYTTTTLGQTMVLDPTVSRHFDLETAGFDANNTSNFKLGTVWNALTYGVDGFHDRVANTTSVAPGLYFTNLGKADALGAVTGTPSGEREAYGAFVQDEARFSEWLRVIGALRYDSYTLDGPTKSLDGDRLSPKLTIGVTPIKGVELYGTYAEAYRAPAITEAFITGLHPGDPFNFLANPNLSPETAKNLEFGVNVRKDGLFKPGDALRVKADYFHNHVDNYIDLVTLYGPYPFGRAVQYQNVGQAVLEGVEIEGAYDWGGGFTKLSGSHTRGKNEDTGNFLLNVPADKLISTVGFRFLNDKLIVGERLSFVWAQDHLPQPFANNIYQPSSSFTTLDLFATYNYSDDLRFDARIDNVFNKQYTNYLDLNASPGISGKLSVTMKLAK